MAIRHEKGYRSAMHDWLYYSADLEQWFRLLIRGGAAQGYLKEVAVAITPPGNKFYDIDDVLELSKEFIYIYDPFKANMGDVYTHILPEHIYNEVVEHIGETVTNKLLDCNYISIIDLKKLITSNDGMYLSEMLDPNPKYDRVKARIIDIPGYYQRPTGCNQYD